MSGFRIQQAANQRLDDIYTYTLDRRGAAQADAYINGLFARFAAIASRDVPWRPMPADFGINGFVCKYERHFIYWKILDNGDVGIVTILHERMHQLDQFRDDWA